MWGGKQGEAIELCVGWQSFDEPANDARAFIEERGVSTEVATQGQGGQTRRMEGREPLLDHTRQLESDSDALSPPFDPGSTPR